MANTLDTVIRKVGVGSNPAGANPAPALPKLEAEQKQAVEDRAGLRRFGAQAADTLMSPIVAADKFGAAVTDIGGRVVNAVAGKGIASTNHKSGDWLANQNKLAETDPYYGVTPAQVKARADKAAAPAAAAVAGEATILPMKPLINTAATPPVVAEKASIGATPVAASNAKYLAALNENGTGNAAGRKEYEAQANKSIDTSSYGGFFNSISDRKRAQRGIEELDKREAIDSQKMLGLGQLSVSEQAGIRADAQNKATNDRNERLDLRQTNMDTAAALQQAHENDDKKRLERYTKTQIDKKTGLMSDYVDRAAMTDMQATADTNHPVGKAADNQDVQSVTRNEGFQYNPDGTPVSAITAGNATIGDAFSSDKVNIWDAIRGNPVLRQNGNAVSVEKANTDKETNFFNSDERNTNQRARDLLAKMHGDLTAAEKKRKKIGH